MFKHPLEPLRTTVLPSNSLPPLLQINDWITNNTDKSILTTSSLFCNSSLLLYSSALFILGLTCCFFLSVLSLSFSCSLICAHYSLFTYFVLFILCSSSLSFLHTMHTIILPFYSSTHFSVRIANLAQSSHILFYSHMLQQLNSQPIKNHESVLLTE